MVYLGIFGKFGAIPGPKIYLPLFLRLGNYKLVFGSPIIFRDTNAFVEINKITVALKMLKKKLADLSRLVKGH